MAGLLKKKFDIEIMTIYQGVFSNIYIRGLIQTKKLGVSELDIHN